LTATVDNIEHIESNTVNGQVIVKVFLQPGSDIAIANAQVTASSQSILRNLPPGTLPPIILNYSASTVPILQLALSGNGLSEQQLNDLANELSAELSWPRFKCATVPAPYGGKQRQIMGEYQPATPAIQRIVGNRYRQHAEQQALVLPLERQRSGASNITLT